MAFADYDRDGDLDAYLVTNWLVPENEDEEADLPDLLGISQRQDSRFARSTKNGSTCCDWTPAGSKLSRARSSIISTAMTTASSSRRRAKCSATTPPRRTPTGSAARWFDYDDDGYPDLYVSNDYYGPDQLFHNNGDGTMTDVAKTALPHTTVVLDGLGCRRRQQRRANGLHGRRHGLYDPLQVPYSRGACRTKPGLSTCRTRSNK